jgi:hypothetical protein
MNGWLSGATLVKVLEARERFDRNSDRCKGHGSALLLFDFEADSAGQTQEFSELSFTI